MSQEQTYIMLKPDAIRRQLMGQIIARIEAKGYQITAMKMMQLDHEVVADHYAHLLDKPFFPELEAYMTSGPVLGMIVEGPEVVAGMRQMMGPTNALEAPAGTIRGDYAHRISENIIHGSDSVENAQIEIKRFFN